MGLHLNYELRLPDSTDAEEVENVLVRLRDFALALPFQSVTEIYRPDFGRFDSRGGGLRFLASVIAKVFVDDTPPLIAHIDLVRGFSVIPGNGCESAAFAFMPRADQSGKHGDWFWHSSCKTQYASVISDAHLVTCHRGLVKLLDHAIAGKLSDHVGVANGRVQAPIFAHPRFERLEMGHDEHGRSELPPASN